MSARDSSTSSPHAKSLSLDNDFCRTHWSRLYHLACQRGCDPQTAQDAVQDLFLNLLRRGHIEALSQQAPVLQAQHLSVRLRHLLINRWRDASRQCRSSSLPDLSLEDDHIPEPAHHETPATQHDRAWLQGCLTQAITRLQSEIPAPVWQHLHPLLLEEHRSPQSGAQRTALHRARKKLRHLVREAMNGSFQDWNHHLPRQRHSAS